MAVVDVTQDAGVLTITLNRPDVLNALNREVHQGIFDALERAKGDDSVRAVVITGAGPRLLRRAGPAGVRGRRR